MASNGLNNIHAECIQYECSFEGGRISCFLFYVQSLTSEWSLTTGSAAVFRPNEEDITVIEKIEEY
jgi:hypothetical protein